MKQAPLRLDELPEADSQERTRRYLEDSEKKSSALSSTRTKWTTEAIKVIRRRFQPLHAETVDVVTQRASEEC